MIHVGDIMSTMGVFRTVGYSNNKRSFLHGTHDIPHGTEHSHGTTHTLYRVIYYLT